MDVTEGGISSGSPPCEGRGLGEGVLSVFTNDRQRTPSEKKVLGSCRKVMIKYAIMNTKKDLDRKPLYGRCKHLCKGEDAQEFIDRLREGRVLACAKIVRNKRKPILIQ